MIWLAILLYLLGMNIQLDIAREAEAQAEADGFYFNPLYKWLIVAGWPVVEVLGFLEDVFGTKGDHLDS